MVGEWRPIREAERAIVDKLLQDNALSLRNIKGDNINTCEVRVLDEYGSIEFKSNNCSETKRENQRLVASGYFNDGDATEIGKPLVNLLLFARGEWLSELQIYKDDGSSIRKPIDADSIVMLV